MTVRPMSHSARERLLNILRLQTAKIGIGIAEPGEIDRINILVGDHGRDAARRRKSKYFSGLRPD